MNRFLRILLITLLAATLIGALALAWHARVRHRHFWSDTDTIRQPAEVEPPRKVLWQPPLALDGLNTGDDEYEPELTPEGSVLLFVRGRPGDDANLYEATRTLDGWTEPSPIAALNTPYDELGPEIAADGRTLYFHSNRPGGQGGYDLWRTTRDDNGWSDPINLGVRVNGPYNEYGAAIAPDGSWLYFASNRPPTEEAMPDDEPWPATIREDRIDRNYDLYRAAVTERGLGEAVALTALNTDQDDGAPAVSPAGDFLYFASNRTTGVGGFDLYRTRLDTVPSFVVENLGPSINTTANELDPTVALGGFRLLYSSNATGQYDLLTTDSREVITEAETYRAEIAWAKLLVALLWLLAALAFLLLLWLLGRLFGSQRFAKMNFVGRALMASAIVHMLLMLLLAMWGVGSSFAEWAQAGTGVRVALTSPSVGAATVSQLRGAAANVAMTTPTLDPTEATESPIAAQTLAVAEAILEPARAELPAVPTIEHEATDADADEPLPTPPLTVTPVTEVASIEVDAPRAAEPTATSERAVGRPRTATMAASDPARPDLPAEATPAPLAESEVARADLPATSVTEDVLASSAPSSAPAPARTTPPVETPSAREAPSFETPAVPTAAPVVEVSAEQPDAAPTSPQAQPALPAMRRSTSNVEVTDAPVLFELPADRLEPAEATSTTDAPLRSATAPPISDATVPTVDVTTGDDATLPGETVTAATTTELRVATPSADAAPMAVRPTVTPTPANVEPTPLLEVDPTTTVRADESLAQATRATDAADAPTRAAPERADAPAPDLLANQDVLELPAALPSTMAEADPREVQEPGARFAPTEVAIAAQDASIDVPFTLDTPAPIETAIPDTDDPTPVRFETEPLVATSDTHRSAPLDAPEPTPLSVPTPDVDPLPALALPDGAHDEPSPEAPERAMAVAPADAPIDPSAKFESPVDIETPPPPTVEVTSAAPSRAPIDDVGLVAEPDQDVEATQPDLAPPVPLTTSDEMALAFPSDLDLAIPDETAPPASAYANRDPVVRDEIIEQLGGSEETEAAVDLGLEWLARYQSPDGRWDSNGFDEQCRCGDPSRVDVDIAVTGLSLLCFLAADHLPGDGGPYDETVANAIDWLLAQQGSDGDLLGNESMYSHGIALIALAEAYGMTKAPRLRESVERGVAFTYDARNTRVGGWRYAPGQLGDTSVMGWQVMALKSARRAGIDVPDEALEVGRDWLRRVDEGSPHGLYSYQPGRGATAAMTAEGLFISQLLGRDPDEVPARTAERFVMRDLPDWDRDPNTYLWYYATLALFQQGGPSWDRWNERLKDALVDNQRQRGRARGSWDANDQWSRTAGRVYQTAICVLTLEVYYRYLPLFMDDDE